MDCEFLCAVDTFFSPLDGFFNGPLHRVWGENSSQGSLYQNLLYIDDFYVVFGRDPLLKLNGSPNGPLFLEKGPL